MFPNITSLGQITEEIDDFFNRFANNYGIFQKENFLGKLYERISKDSDVQFMATIAAIERIGFKALACVLLAMSALKPS